MKRPAHLLRRQTEGRWFSEEVTLRRRPEGTRTNRGEWVQAPATSKTIRCATAPGEAEDAYAVSVTGNQPIRITAVRVFYLHHDIEVKADSDVIVWNGDRYIARSVQDYGDVRVVQAIRQEPQ